jgi:AcrR family transcriptional regulator
MRSESGAPGRPPTGGSTPADPPVTGRERATRDRGRRTVARLIEAGVEEFSSHGYHNARIARITKRAGCSYGTFYLYFEDKDDLIWEALVPYWKENLALMRSLCPLEPTAAGRAALEAWVRQVCDLYLRYEALLRACNEAYGTSPKLAQRGVDELSGYIHVLADRIHESDVVGLDPNTAALVIYATLEGANYMYASGTLVANYRELVSLHTEFIHQSLFGVSTTGPSNNAPEVRAAG